MPFKHTSAQLLGRPDPASVTISRVEYNSLLRISREYEMLKNALFQGGLTTDTLALLISGSGNQPQQPPVDSWADECSEQPPSYGQYPTYQNGNVTRNESSWKVGTSTRSFNQAPRRVTPNQSDQQQPRSNLQAPNGQRQVSYGVVPSSVPEDYGFEDGDSFLDKASTEIGMAPSGTTMRTLYFCGFNARTTYRDLVSVIKGGKLLSVNIRSERSATVTFLNAAADYLTWTKRNDVYLHAKRVDVRWADRQYNLNGHISSKIANGATRNILIRNAQDKGMTEAQIRDDMEHIHNLVIIDITFRNRHAYVSTNSVHNALFARTCMMSRSTYKGCKIEFYPDECDVPLPTRAQAQKAMPQEPSKKPTPFGNRFDMLNVDGDNSSNEENREPMESYVGDSDDEDAETLDEIKARHGVRLDFLDSESTV